MRIPGLNINLGWEDLLIPGISLPTKAIDAASGGKLTELYEDASGISGLEDEQAANRQRMDLTGQMYDQSMEYMDPYRPNAGFTRGFQEAVEGGAFIPQYDQYQGPMGYQGGPQMQQFDPYSGFGSDYGNYQMGQAPQFNQWQPGQAPELNQFQMGQHEIAAAPTQGMSSVQGRPGIERGPTGEVSSVMGAPEQQAYQRGQFDITKDPGYQFRLGEGEKAIKRAAAAKGGYGDPAMMKELLGFSQGLASEEADRAYGRFSTDEAAQQAGFESAAQRGLQGYGIEAPLRTGVQESLADRGMSEWATRKGLDLQGYGIEAPMQYRAQEDYAGRLSDDWKTTQGLGMDQYLGAGGINQRAQSDYQGNLLNRYGTEQGLAYQGARDYDQNVGDMYKFGEEMKYDIRTGERDAGMGAYTGDRDFQQGQYEFELPQRYNMFADDRGFGYDVYADQQRMQNAPTQAAYNQQAGLYDSGQAAASGMANLATGYGMNMANLYNQQGQLSAARSQAPANFWMDVGQMGLQGAGMAAGMGFNPFGGAGMAGAAGGMGGGMPMQGPYSYPTPVGYA